MRVSAGSGKRRQARCLNIIGLSGTLRPVGFLLCSYFLLFRQKKVTKKRRPLMNRSAHCGQAVRCCLACRSCHIALPFASQKCAPWVKGEDVDWGGEMLQFDNLAMCQFENE